MVEEVRRCRYVHVRVRDYNRICGTPATVYSCFGLASGQFNELLGEGFTGTFPREKLFIEVRRSLGSAFGEHEWIDLYQAMPALPAWPIFACRPACLPNSFFYALPPSITHSLTHPWLVCTCARTGRHARGGPPRGPAGAVATLRLPVRAGRCTCEGRPEGKGEAAED